MNLFGEEELPGGKDGAYRVLARKYRPTVFEDLIGQDVLVRTLSNAIKTGRLAHAFLLTGIRGIGKTTTARLIARALNCIGADGQSGPTIQPCGVCSNCVMIAEDRHMDVLEMDAASRTGVNDIRELIDTVHYAPTSARYKIYIIDEVHMLSNSAFNALLKTLEEPPPHVKFIFATTELRKIPVTILSRCQTFELKRVDGDVLTEHLARICAKENVEAEDTALQLVAAAAEGSVRDSLSLLDQAIAHGTDESGKAGVKAEAVRGMLGLADRSRSFTLLGHAFAGEVQPTLAAYQAQYKDGADPAFLLQELMVLVHFVTRVKLVPDLANAPEFAEVERTHARDLASKMEVPHLTRAWQLLNKGLQEARLAPNPFAAVEMALIRLMHAANLPSPAELVRTVQEGGPVASAPRPDMKPSVNVSHSAPAPRPSSYNAPASGGSSTSAAPRVEVGIEAVEEDAEPEPAPIAQLAPVAAPSGGIHSFEDVVAQFKDRREMLIWSHLYQNAHLVKFEPGRIEVKLTPAFPQDLTGRIGKMLTDWTGDRWLLVISAVDGQPTLKQQEVAAKAKRLADASEHPLVQDIMKQFEGAKIIDLRPNMNKVNEE